MSDSLEAEFSKYAVAVEIEECLDDFAEQLESCSEEELKLWALTLMETVLVRGYHPEGVSFGSTEGLNPEAFQALVLQNDEINELEYEINTWKIVLGMSWLCFIAFVLTCIN
jgi:hypothetical protein